MDIPLKDQDIVFLLKQLETNSGLAFCERAATEEADMTVSCNSGLHLNTSIKAQKRTPTHGIYSGP